ncbi:MAG TPA: hypothetical protein VJM12_03360 [Pyrinomonadaceae bacterium]|nr:hypothetical protein [Pyrinomonadaceae bacterium]
MSNANQPHASVVAILEEYLRSAGLFEIIAEHRRPQVLRWHPTFTKDAFWILVWLGIFWVPEIGVVLASNGRTAMMFAFIAPPVTLAGYGVLLTLLFIGFVLTNRNPSLALSQPSANEPAYADWQKHNERVGLIGVFALVLGTPLLLALMLWLYINAAPLAALYLGIYVALMLFTLLLIGASDAVLFRLYVVKGFCSMTWQIVREILRHLPFIASVLLVIVLFSIFSTEFWEALGNLKTSNLFICIALLIALPLVFAVSSIHREAKQTLNLSDRRNLLQKVVIEPAENNKFIKDALDDDRLKTEDWVKAKRELEWRATAKLCENIQPILRKHATWWLRVLLTSTVLFLFVAFFIYFLALFYFLIEPEILAKWLAGGRASAQIERITIPVPLIGWQHEWPSTVLSMAKVSLLLSAFIAMMSTVHVLTEESVKTRFTEQLTEQARSWIALSCIYRNLILPGYERWGAIYHKGVASVSIVTRKPADLSSVKSACIDVRSHFRQPKLVYVTAFEQCENETAYSYGMQANCWQMILDHETDGEDPEQVFALPEASAPANNGRFGNTPLAEELSQTLRERIPTVQQIYVFEGRRFFNVVIRGEKLPSRQDYFNLMQNSIGVFSTPALSQRTIAVYVYNGDTQEELAFLLYSQPMDFVAYRHSFDGRIRFLKSRKLFRASA